MTLNHALEITYLTRRLQYLTHADKDLRVIPSNPERLPDFLKKYSDVCSRERLIELLRSMPAEDDPQWFFRDEPEMRIKFAFSMS